MSALSILINILEGITNVGAPSGGHDYIDGYDGAESLPLDIEAQGDAFSTADIFVGGHDAAHSTTLQFPNPHEPFQSSIGTDLTSLFGGNGYAGIGPTGPNGGPDPGPDLVMHDFTNAHHGNPQTQNPEPVDNHGMTPTERTAWIRKRHLES